MIWTYGWIPVLALAVGILIGRAIERRRWHRWLRLKTSAAETLRSAFSPKSDGPP